MMKSTILTLALVGCFVLQPAHAQVTGVSVNSTASALQVRATVNAAYAFKQVYLCGLSGNGWPVAGQRCGEMIENGSRWRYIGTNNAWSWEFLGSAPFAMSGNGNVLTTEFPMGSLQSQTAYSVVVQGHGGGVALANAVLSTTPPSTAPLLSLAPLYVAPTGQASDPLLAIARQRGTVIINGNNNGSGGVCSPGSRYPATVRLMQDAGATVALYLHASYGARDVSAMLRDLGGYACLSGNGRVATVFIDESPMTMEGLGMLRAVKDEARRLGFGGRLMVNPGATSVSMPELTATLVEAYMDVAEVVVTFEGSFSSYRDRFQAHPSWTTRFPAARFAHLLHSTSAAEAVQAAQLARARRAGVFGATDRRDLPENTWGGLPSYWSSLPSILTTR